MSERDHDEATTTRGALRSFAVVAFSGVDAEAFLHAQTANDVKALPVGAWQWNCCLTPQGRVIALFVLARLAPGELVAVLPEAAATPWLADLRRYVFRSKVRFAVSDAWLAHGTIAARAPSIAPASGGLVASRADGWSIALGGASLRDLHVVERASAAADAAAIDDAWRAADIADLVPRIAGPTAGEHTPHALALQRLSAFSTSKGCYPGQEIVARTHFLGRNKRRPARFEGTGSAPLPGDRLLAAPGAADAAADTIDAIAVATRVEGLAVLRGEAPATLFRASGDDPSALVVVSD